VASITGSLSFASSSLVFNNNTSNFIQMPHSSTYSVFDGDFTIDHWITVDAFVTVFVNDIIGFYFKGSTNVEANPGFGARMDRNTNAANFGKGFLVANIIPNLLRLVNIITHHMDRGKERLVHS